MSDALHTYHSPAVRVGGRRLSMTASGGRGPKHHNVTASSVPSPMRPDVNTDYPRPAAQGEGDEQAQVHPPPHNEEEAPKKDKKHTHGGHDQNRLKESAYRKLEATTPSKDYAGTKHTFGAAGRIGQPMGKLLAV